MPDPAIQPLGRDQLSGLALMPRLTARLPHRPLVCLPRRAPTLSPRRRRIRRRRQAAVTRIAVDLALKLLNPILKPTDHRQQRIYPLRVQRLYVLSQHACKIPCVTQEPCSAPRHPVSPYVKKPMVECTGNEILTEFLHHLGLEDTAEEFLTHAKVSLAGMPYITSQFMPRAIGDRPRVIPDGCANLGFLGQFVEVDDDCVFTVETSVRTAMEAVYGLLQLDKPVIPVSPTKFDIRHIAGLFRSNLEVEGLHLKDLLNPLLLKDLLKLLLPAVVHPREIVGLAKRIPKPTDVRPGT
jgi:hypothetical protein